jgi:hypothetical protein
MRNPMALLACQNAVQQRAPFPPARHHHCQGGEGGGAAKEEHRTRPPPPLSRMPVPPDDPFRFHVCTPWIRLAELVELTPTREEKIITLITSQSCSPSASRMAVAVALALGAG